MDDKKLINPIDEDFNNVPSSDVTLNLFSKGDITRKTDINQKELVILNCMTIENQLLNETFVNFDLFTEFIDSFKHHKVSLDRKSRQEFVETNKPTPMSSFKDVASPLKNLVESRK